MSRRNQSRRRRTYGRRQHEVRERRSDGQPASGWLESSDELGWSDGDYGREQGDSEQNGLGAMER